MLVRLLLALVLLPFAVLASTSRASTPLPVDEPYEGTLTLAVDATDLSHRILRVKEQIPVQQGPLTLLYPQWIPGDHSPTGTIDKLAGLVITSNGQRLSWMRDPLDVYAFKLDVPSAAATLEVTFDVLTPTADDQKGSVVMTPDMLALQWNMVALYPAGHYAHRIDVAPSVTLPHGWQAATALDLEARDGDTLRFKQVPLDTLLDSPLYAGLYVSEVELGTDNSVPVRLSLFADHPRFLEMKSEQLDAHRKLVQQAYELFGKGRYRHYDFLLVLSDQMGKSFGLEHHQSSENGLDASYFVEWDKSTPHRDLLPHEFAHSWNGKFRRPADLWTPNFNVPMQDSLLWVYEGQTEYWGFALAARSGLWTAEQARDELAVVAARYTTARPGFAWRNLQDTTNDPVIAQRSPLAYRSYQLSEDYYSGGELLWLAVDCKLRELTQEKRSLDDFARAFFGKVDAGAVATYTFEDVVGTLNELAPYDWQAFLRQRLDANAPPLDGLAASGWQLVYDESPTASYKNQEAEDKLSDFTWSLGLAVKEKDGAISAVRWDGPAFAAGVSSGSTLVAVDGREYKPDRLKDAIKAAQTGTQPIELLVKHGDLYRTVRVDYHDGPKYPHLERIAGTPDRLEKILAPRSSETPQS